MQVLPPHTQCGCIDLRVSRATWNAKRSQGAPIFGTVGGKDDQVTEFGTRLNETETYRRTGQAIF
jgi:hypothetical protein